MTCSTCSRSVRMAPGSHQYKECGLNYVFLIGVPVGVCSCGERLVSIPRIVDLHRLIASRVARKGTRLVPAEIRFLRKFLGQSGKDFARYMGVTPETVSRWESADHNEPMSAPAERLLRVMVFFQPPKDDYDLELLANIKSGSPRPLPRLDLESKRQRWLAPA